MKKTLNPLSIASLSKTIALQRKTFSRSRLVKAFSSLMNAQEAGRYFDALKNEHYFKQITPLKFTFNAELSKFEPDAIRDILLKYHVQSVFGKKPSVSDEPKKQVKECLNLSEIKFEDLVKELTQRGCKITITW